MCIRDSLCCVAEFFALPQAGMKKAEEKGSDLRYSYMFWLPFMAVFREGIETVIFLAGTSSNYEVWPRFNYISYWLTTLFQRSCGTYCTGPHMINMGIRAHFGSITAHET